MIMLEVSGMQGASMHILRTVNMYEFMCDELIHYSAIQDSFLPNRHLNITSRILF
jgi:hypothetical protein